MDNRYNDDELADLTAEEREGLKELAEETGSDAGDGGAAPGADAGNAGGAAGADDGAGAEAAAAAAAEAAAEAAAAKTAAVADGGAPPSSFPDYQMPENYDERMSTIDNQRKEVAKQFDDGDITGSEMNAKLTALNREESQLNEARIRAELAYDVRLEGWRTTVHEFIDANPQYKPGSVLFTALDAQVRALQDKAPNPFSPSIMQDAHRHVQAEVRAALGLPAELVGKDRGAADPAAQPAAKPKPAAPEIPPTLAGVPAAALEDTGQGDSFAYLDRLQATDYEKFEAALAALSDADRARYERG